jgi:hypothetical protein
VKVIDALYNIKGAVCVRVIQDGVVLGSCVREQDGVWLTLQGQHVHHRGPIGDFLPTLVAYHRLVKIVIITRR